jgi:hypothetical protein
MDLDNRPASGFGPDEARRLIDEWRARGVSLSLGSAVGSGIGGRLLVVEPRTALSARERLFLADPGREAWIKHVLLQEELKTE